MKKIIFFSLIVSLFYYSSCKNTDPLSGKTIVRGHIFEADTIVSKSLEGVFVNLLEKPYDSGSTYIIDSIYTNIHGEFEFSFEAESATYQLEANKTMYYGGIYGNQVIYPNRENEYELTMSPRAWLHIHAKNINPFDSQDKLTANTSEFWGASAESHYGTDVDFKIVIPLPGNAYHKYRWNVVKNSQSQFYTEDIFVEGHDTTYYELFY